MRKKPVQDKINILIELYNKKKFASLINEANKFITEKIIHEQIYNIMGISFLNLKQINQAILCFKNAIKVNTEFLDAYNNLGCTYRDKHEFNHAIKNFKKVLRLNPNFIEALINLSYCYSQNKNYNDALSFLEQALRLSPGSPNIRFNIGSILIEQENYQKALRVFQELAYENPTESRVFNNLGNAYKFLDDYEKASNYYKKSIELDKNNKEALWNLSYCSLYNFNFIDGWKYYGLRWEMNNNVIPQENFFKPIWDGTSKGTILVLPEQGVGDQILFSRCLESCKIKNNKLILLVSGKLAKLFQHSFNKIEITENIDNISFDFVIPLADLAKFCILDNFSLSKISNNYLKTNKKLTSSIRDKFSKKKVLCGLSWTSKNLSVGKNKSINLEKFKSLLSIENIIFIDLQYVDSSKERDEFLKIHGIEIIKLHEIDSLNDIFTLASLIDACDFVISISNSIAHLAGAIGKKTFLLLPKGKGKYWYWSLSRGVCIWYPSVEIYSQNDSGVWEDPIEQLKHKIIQLIS